MSTQITENTLIQMFIDLDDFCQCYDQWLASRPDQDRAAWSCGLSRSEAMAILAYYHHSGYKCFEYYYERLVQGAMRTYFPKLVGYKYFLSLIPACFDHLFLFAQWQGAQAQRTGIYYVDSKRLPVCHNKRIHSHRVFDGIAQRGKSSTGWFFGLKIHLIVNNLGEIVTFLFSSANFSDNNQQVLRTLLAGLQGTCYGDKGYLSTLFEEFFAQGLKIVTKVKRNMKNKLMPLHEKYQLSKRGIIESVNDILMTVCNIEHTRHRSPANAMAHMLAALVGYNYIEQKPHVFFPNLVQA